MAESVGPGSSLTEGEPEKTNTEDEEEDSSSKEGEDISKEDTLETLGNRMG